MENHVSITNSLVVLHTQTSSNCLYQNVMQNVAVRRYEVIPWLLSGASPQSRNRLSCHPSLCIHSTTTRRDLCKTGPRLTDALLAHGGEALARFLRKRAAVRNRPGPALLQETCQRRAGPRGVLVWFCKGPAAAVGAIRRLSLRRQRYPRLLRSLLPRPAGPRRRGRRLSPGASGARPGCCGPGWRCSRPECG